MKNRKMITKDQYIDVVVQKLQKAKPFLALGPLPEDSIPLRDEQGIMHCFSNVLNIAGNFFDFRGGEDVVADKVENFANASIGNFSGETYGDVSLVQTMGAIDVTIMSLANSLIPFLAVDRAMANPVDTIYYAQLVSTNAAGGVASGAVVMDNFAPPNPSVNLGPDTVSMSVTATTTSQTVNLNEYLVPGSVTVTIVRGASTFIAKDFNKDGTLYFNGVAIPGLNAVNYSTGAVVLPSGVANGDVITVTGLLDVGADTSGTNILKIRANHVPIQLVSQPKQFIFEENEHANLYMNKIMAQAAKAGAISDYRDLHFGRLTNMYIENINRDLIKIAVALSAFVTPVNGTLAGYGATASQSMTKDDLVSKFFIDMTADLVSRTTIPATVCITGTQGTSVLRSHATKWVGAATVNTQDRKSVV